MEFENSNLGKIGDYGVMNHEIEGANYLRNLGFSENVCSLVKNHINTKRYLIKRLRSTRNASPNSYLSCI